MRCIVLGLAGVVLGSSLSCKATYPTAPEVPQVVALQIQYAAPTPDPRVGRTTSFLAYAVDSEDVWTDVTRQTTWSATDSSIIRASTGSPTVLAIGVGVTTIVGSYAGLSGSIRITVRPQFPEYPQLEFTNLSGGPVGVGQSGGATLARQLSLTSASTFVTSLATWTSSNPEVATVRIINSGAAGFDAVGTGTTRITASLDGQAVSLEMSVGPRR